EPVERAEERLAQGGAVSRPGADALRRLLEGAAADLAGARRGDLVDTFRCRLDVELQAQRAAPQERLVRYRVGLRQVRGTVGQVERLAMPVQRHERVGPVRERRTRTRLGPQAQRPPA